MNLKTKSLSLLIILAIIITMFSVCLITITSNKANNDLAYAAKPSKFMYDYNIWFDENNYTPTESDGHLSLNHWSWTYYGDNVKSNGPVNTTTYQYLIKPGYTLTFTLDNSALHNINKIQFYYHCVSSDIDGQRVKIKMGTEIFADFPVPDNNTHYSESAGGVFAINAAPSVITIELINAGTADFLMDLTAISVYRDIDMYTISLDSGEGVTTAGTETIYEDYRYDFTLDNYVSQVMTTSENNITIPTKEGFTFDGYFTEASGGTKIIDKDGYIVSTAADGTAFTDDGTLYAHWTDNTPPAEEEGSSGGSGSGSGDSSVTPATPDSGSDSSKNADKASHGFCVGWVGFIFVILELLCACLYVIIRFGLFQDLVVKCKLDSLFGKLDLLGLIGLAVSGVMFIFTLIALCVHPCGASITSFIFAFIICGGFTFLFLEDKGITHLLPKKTEDKPQE